MTHLRVGYRPRYTLRTLTDVVAVSTHAESELDKCAWGYPSRPESRVDSDLKLLKACPETELLLRYEAAAERELHRSVGTFLKLRQHPELVSPEEPPPAPAGSAVRSGSRERTPRTMPAARNEATLPERLDPDSGPQIGRAGSPAPEIRRL